MFRYGFARCCLAFVSVSAALMQGCSVETDVPAPIPAAAPPTLASQSDVAIVGNLGGPTPFVNFVEVRGSSIADVTHIAYVVEGKPNTVSKPVAVRYSLTALQQRGYVGVAAGVATLPVFGLYADYSNHVEVRLIFRDASMQTLSIDILTQPYVDARGVYDHVSILKSRSAQDALGFDYFAMKSTVDSPVIVDTDGNVRWVAGVAYKSTSTAFAENGFVVGDSATPTLRRLELDGLVEQRPLLSSAYKNFHHNIDAGKFGMLVEVDEFTDVGSSLIEITPAGSVLKEWDFAAILESYMNANGDDASAFVRHGKDWFHMNGAVYDASDDSIIASSRENFVIKVDYSTGNIIWILGDPTKYWYTFSSLRAKAVTITNGGLYPMGQHAPSITSTGLLMMFNDGAESFNQPAGMPVGDNLTYSTVSAYSIDGQNATAEAAWTFDYGQAIFSRICSSAYEASDESVLVSYAYVAGGTKARLVGIDSARNVVFDFEYPSVSGCATSWNAIPLPLDNLHFD